MYVREFAHELVYAREFAHEFFPKTWYATNSLHSAQLLIVKGKIFLHKSRRRMEEQRYGSTHFFFSALGWM